MTHSASKIAITFSSSFHCTWLPTVELLFWRNPFGHSELFQLQMAAHYRGRHFRDTTAFGISPSRRLQGESLKQFGGSNMG